MIRRRDECELLSVGRKSHRDEIVCRRRGDLDAHLRRWSRRGLTRAPGGACPRRDRGKKARGQPRDTLAPVPAWIGRVGRRRSGFLDIEARVADVGQALRRILVQAAAQGAPNVARRIVGEAGPVGF
jgi:hypothetical protein